MSKKRLEQKLVSFSNNDETELSAVKNDMQHGWNIISLVTCGGRYVGIMEKSQLNSSNPTVFIPPRKKIRLIK